MYRTVILHAFARNKTDIGKYERYMCLLDEITIARFYIYFRTFSCLYSTVRTEYGTLMSCWFCAARSTNQLCLQYGGTVHDEYSEQYVTLCTVCRYCTMSSRVKLPSYSVHMSARSHDIYSRMMLHPE
jgi:hypothetical protein